MASQAEGLLRPLTRALLQRALDPAVAGRGAGVPRTVLIFESVLEDAEIGDLWGTLSTVNKPDDWGDDVYTITSDPDGVAQIDGDRIEVAAALDYETASSHSIEITNTPTGPYDPIVRTFSLKVGNVLEVTLNDPLTLSGSTFPDDAEPGAELVDIIGKSPGSAIVIDPPDARLALNEGMDKVLAGIGSWTAEEAIAFSLVESHPDAANSPNLSNLELTPTAEAFIAAPLDVMVIEPMTNPPGFVMNVKKVGPGAVMIGDIPQVRYNGAGTIYDGNALASLDDNPSFVGLPAQPIGPGFAQFRFVRDIGGPAELIGAWSSESEGQFEIEEVVPSAGVNLIDMVGLDEGNPTSSVDVGTGAARALVFFGNQNQMAVSSVTIGTDALDLVAGAEATAAENFYLGFFDGALTVENSQTATVASTAGFFDAKGLGVLTYSGLEVVDGGAGYSGDFTVSVEAGDWLVVAAFGGTVTFTDSPTEAPVINPAPDPASIFFVSLAVFDITATDAAFDTGMTPGGGKAVAYVLLRAP